MLCPEIVFANVKNNTVVKSLNILGNTFVSTAYADGTIFFLKKSDSIKKLLNRIYFHRFQV